MYISDKKKHEYWNHFVASAFTERMPPGVTGPRLRKIKSRLWRDTFFWQDVILRHGGDKITPEEMKRNDPDVYDHCQGNFWGMVIQDLMG